MLTPEQLEQRLNYICGSDVGAILGVNDWSTPVDVWLQKTRRKEAEDISDKPAVKAGNMLEEAVAQWFAAVTGKEIYGDNTFHVHKSIPHLGGNVDRFIVGENAILECKTTQSDRGWGAGYLEGDNKIPDSYLCQVIHYCAVTNRDVAYVAVLIRGIDFRWYRYERDVVLEEQIIGRCTSFWLDNVKADVAPEPKTAEEVTALLRGKISDDYVQADIEIQTAVENFKDARDDLKKIEENQKYWKDIVCSYMKDKQTLVNTDGTIAVTWKQREGSVRFDTKSFKEAHPELYKQFETKGDYVRTFLVK